MGGAEGGDAFSQTRTVTRFNGNYVFVRFSTVFFATGLCSSNWERISKVRVSLLHKCGFGKNLVGCCLRGEIIKYAKWVFAERMAGLLVLGGFVAQVAGAEEWDDKMRVGGVWAQIPDSVYLNVCVA